MSFNPTPDNIITAHQRLLHASGAMFAWRHTIAKDNKHGERNEDMAQLLAWGKMYHEAAVGLTPDHGLSNEPSKDTLISILDSFCREITDAGGVRQDDRGVAYLGDDAIGRLNIGSIGCIYEEACKALGRSPLYEEETPDDD